MSEPLSFTGERFIPGPEGEICYEHWHRYMLASRFGQGCSVLDVACGEGYGSSLLANVADKVTGVDISGDAVEHARERYQGQTNLEFIQGSCEELPLPDNSIDLAVSFETIEHLEMQEKFIQELKRVLKPAGLLLMSSPNKQIYSDARDFHNEFHVRELYRDEFDQLLGNEFSHIHWFSQKLLFHSAIWPESGDFDATEYLLMTPEGVKTVSNPGVEAMYYLVVCGTQQEALAGIENKLSLFGHSAEIVYKDYVDVTRRVMGLDKILIERDQSLLESSKQVEVLREQQSELQHQLELKDGHLAKRQEQVLSLETELAARADLIQEQNLQLSAKAKQVEEIEQNLSQKGAVIDDLEQLIAPLQQQLEYQTGLRWWLKSPLRLLKNWLERIQG